MMGGSEKEDSEEYYDSDSSATIVQEENLEYSDSDFTLVEEKIVNSDIKKKKNWFKVFAKVAVNVTAKISKDVREVIEMWHKKDELNNKSIEENPIEKAKKEVLIAKEKYMEAKKDYEMLISLKRKGNLVKHEKDLEKSLEEKFKEVTLEKYEKDLKVAKLKLKIEKQSHKIQQPKEKGEIDIESKLLKLYEAQLKLIQQSDKIIDKKNDQVLERNEKRLREVEENLGKARIKYIKCEEDFFSKLKEYENVKKDLKMLESLERKKKDVGLKTFEEKLMNELKDTKNDELLKIHKTKLEEKEKDLELAEKKMEIAKKEYEIEKGGLSKAYAELIKEEIDLYKESIRRMDAKRDRERQKQKIQTK